MPSIFHNMLERVGDVPRLGSALKGATTVKDLIGARKHLLQMKALYQRVLMDVEQYLEGEDGNVIEAEEDGGRVPHHLIKMFMEEVQRAGVEPINAVLEEIDGLEIPDLKETNEDQKEAKGGTAQEGTKTKGGSGGKGDRKGSASSGDQGSGRRAAKSIHLRN